MAEKFATPTVERIRDAVREWISLLARRDFAGAAAFLTPLPRAKYTADTLKQALGLYRRAYRDAPEGEKDRFLPIVTDTREMDCRGETMVIYTKTDIGEALVEYDLPIDGTWSDLTAKFVLMRDGNEYGIGLYDLRVL